MSRLVAATVLFLLVLPPAAAQTVAVLEPVTVHGRVEGDVVALLGDVRVAADADVRGDVVAVLGRVRLEPGATIAGHALEVRSLAGLEVVDVRTPRRAPAVGAALIGLGLWLAAVGLAVLLVPRAVERAAAGIGTGAGVAAGIGIFAVMVLLAACVAALGSGPLAVPAVVGVVVVALMVKAAGLAALGLGLARPLLPASPVPLAAGCGAAVLLLSRLVPGVGGVLWVMVSVAAFGAGVLVAAAVVPVPSAVGREPAGARR